MNSPPPSVRAGSRIHQTPPARFSREVRCALWFPGHFDAERASASRGWLWKDLGPPAKHDRPCAPDFLRLVPSKRGGLPKTPVQLDETRAHGLSSTTRMWLPFASDSLFCLVGLLRQAEALRKKHRLDVLDLRCHARGQPVNLSGTRLEDCFH